MHVVAGTLNPGKLTGAEAAVRRYWPDAAFAGVAVDHGTAAQPLTREQTLEGAIARARLARRHADADIGLGIEGGTVETVYGMLVELWVAALTRSGELHIGGGPSIELPVGIAAEVRRGRELGPVVDEHFQVTGQKHGGGVIALLTAGNIERIEVCRLAVLCALAPIARRSSETGPCPDRLPSSR